MSSERVRKKFRQLKDVVFGTPADGDVVQYDAASNMLVLGPAAGGGVTEHGALTGLADDDHGQYHTDARGDARYWPLATDLATQVELNAEAATRAAAAAAHDADTSVHGIPDTTVLATDAEVATAVANHAAAADPHAGYQKESEKGAAGGYASLDGSGDVPDSEIPPSITRDAELTAAIAAHEAAGDPHPTYSTAAELSAAISAALALADGAGLTEAGGVLAVNVDGLTLEIDSDTVRVKAGGIDVSHLAFDPATQAELNALAATVATDAELAAALAAHEAAGDPHPTYTTAAELAAAISAALALADGAGLSEAGGVLAVNVDDSTIEINADTLRVKDGGITAAKVAADVATQAELDSHTGDPTAAHPATAIAFTPAGAIAATNVQAAIEEVASEAGGGVTSLDYETRSTNTILGVADKGKTIDITATITQTFSADETLGDGWWVILRNATDEGTVVVTLDPAGTETIDGLTTVTMYSGEARLVICNGAGGNFNSILLEGGFARFTADGNFIVPHGITQATVECIGGGGGGGGGRGAAAGGIRQGGSAGGGAVRVRNEVAAAALGNPGDTIAVDVAAGGTSGAGGSAASGSDGGVGGNTTFGSIVTGHGGGNGIGGLSTANPISGGGGGGDGSAGGPGVANAPSQGGSNGLAVAAGTPGLGKAGAGSPTTTTSVNCNAHDGGGAGGIVAASGAAGQNGGRSVNGGGGGAGGAGLPTGNTEFAGGVGGAAGFWGGSTGLGGTAGAVDGGAGGAGPVGTFLICGGGGGGGGSQASGTGGVGGVGGAPGGGAGGGGGGTTVGGAGGVGGIGECRVWYS